MGPLEVTDVTANGCHLKWKKPEDDGGEPIDYYQASDKSLFCHCCVYKNFPV